MGLFTIDPATVDPNLLYFALLTSLWIGVSAAYVPGTVIIEFVAAIGFVASLIIVSQMSVSWVALLSIVVGVSAFMVMPFIKQRYAALAVIGLFFQGLGGVFLFNGDQSVSLFVVAVTIALPLTYHQLVLMPLLRNANLQPVYNKDDELIGKVGRVTKDIDPIGAVLVESESWTATSETSLKQGDVVVVVDRSGLQLVVEKVKQKIRENGTETLAM